MILCCGEALIDMLPQVNAQGELCFTPIAGGGVFNTAIALGRLGASSALLTGISNDMMGDVLMEALTQSQVKTHLVVRPARPCTLAFVKLVNGQASYAFYDEGTAGRLLSIDEMPPALPPTIHTLFFGGISLINAPAADSYEQLQRQECAQRTIMLDPNIRPGFIPPEHEASYRERLARMIARADIVKLSDDDLYWLEGRDDMAKLAQGLLHKGPRLVLITQGDKGAWAFSAAHQLFVPAKRVTVVDTIGAGDTFNAGVLAALSQQNCLDKAAIGAASAEVLSAALTLGIQAAAVTVSRAGANPPWAREMQG